MPPVTKAGGEDFRKNVEFVTKDDDEQVATGIVMVPHAVDLQRDFVHPDTIERFAEQFGNFEDVGEADGGVMHAVWPSDHTELERNEVLDEPTEIGGTTVPEGAWVQSYKFEDEELWSLVEDGILEGYSIGAINVDWGGPYEQADLPDEVSVPDAIDEDELVYELKDGTIQEVSVVDIPAVPDAMILETKADAEKRLANHLGNRDGFLAEAQERGHSEGEAERLWEYLNRAVDIEGAGKPGKQSVLARAGKAFLSALSGSDDGANAAKAPEAPDGGYEVAPTANNPDAGKDTSEKEGRTLSRQNRESLYATIDASLDVLEDAGVDHGMERFTDRDDTNFDLSEHSAREWPDPDDEDDEPEEGDGGEESAGTDGPPFESASGGDTPDDTTDMTETTTDDNPWEDAPEWAKDLRDGQKENSERIDEIASKSDGDGDSGGEEEKAAWEDAPAWAKDLRDNQKENSERIDTISTQTGTTDSQQLGKGAGEETEKSEFTLDPRNGGN